MPTRTHATLVSADAQPAVGIDTSDLWLSVADVAVLTGLRPGSWAAQCRRLARMGVPFITNGAGRPLVERAAVLQTRAVAPRKPQQPNWAALRGA